MRKKKDQGKRDGKSDMKCPERDSIPSYHPLPNFLSSIQNLPDKQKLPCTFTQLRDYITLTFSNIADNLK